MRTNYSGADPPVSTTRLTLAHQPPFVRSQLTSPALPMGPYVWVVFNSKRFWFPVAGVDKTSAAFTQIVHKAPQLLIMFLKCTISRRWERRRWWFPLLLSFLSSFSTSWITWLSSLSCCSIKKFARASCRVLVFNVDVWDPTDCWSPMSW